MKAKIKYDKDFKKVVKQLQTNYGWYLLDMMTDKYKNFLNDTIIATKEVLKNNKISVCKHSTECSLGYDCKLNKNQCFEFEQKNSELQPKLKNKHIMKTLPQPITEAQVIKLGFKFEKSYNHDEFKTNRYIKNCITVEFTYEDDMLLACDATISEINGMNIDIDKLKLINKALGDWSDN